MATPTNETVLQASQMTLEEKIAAQEAMFGGAQSTPVALKECTSCGRKFNEKALKSHSKICAKVFVEKREAFDMKSARADEDIAKAQAKAEHRQSAVDAKLAEMKEKAKKAWRAESAKLRNAANACKGGPMIEIADDRVECPKCGRKFAEETAKRHIPKCSAKPKQAMVRKPIAKKPMAKKLLAKRPAAKKAAAKRVPLPTRPAAKKPVAKKPVVKRPAAKRPAAKRKSVMARVDDRVECPNCNRKFTKRSAPHHIEICKPKKTSAKKPAMKKKKATKRPAKKRVGLMAQASVDDRVECPTCHRKFTKRSAPHHIEMCQKRSAPK